MVAFILLQSTLSLSVSERTSHTDVTDLSTETTAGSATENAALHVTQSLSSTLVSSERSTTTSVTDHKVKATVSEVVTHSRSQRSTNGTGEVSQVQNIETNVENSSSLATSTDTAHVHQTPLVAMETDVVNQARPGNPEVSAGFGAMVWQRVDISEGNNVSSSSSSSDLIPVPHEMITKVTEKKGWLSGRSVVSPEQSRPGERQARNTENNTSQENTYVKTVSSTAENGNLPSIHASQKTDFSVSEISTNNSMTTKEVSNTVMTNHVKSSTAPGGNTAGENGVGDSYTYNGNTPAQSEVHDVEKLKGEYDFDTNSYLQTMQTFTSLHRNKESLSEDGGAARFSPPVKDPGMQPSRPGGRVKSTRYEQKAEETLKVESKLAVVDQNGNRNGVVNVRSAGSNGSNNVDEWSSDRNNSTLPLHMPVDTSTPVKGPPMNEDSGIVVNQNIDTSNGTISGAHAYISGETIRSTVQSVSVQSSIQRKSQSETAISHQTNVQGNVKKDGIDQDITDTKLSERSFIRNVSHNVSHSSVSLTEVSKTSMVVNIDETSRHKGNGDDTTGDLSLGNNSAAAGEGADLSRSERNEFYTLQEEVLKLRREKAHLEGKVEILEGEAKVAIKERSELQSHLAAVSTQLKSQEKNHKTVVGDKNALSADLETLKQNRQRLELVVMDAQKLIEEKDHDLKTLSEDLKLAHAANEKLQDRMKDLRHEMLAKDETVQALKNKVAELYVEYQTSLQSRILADNEVKSLQSDVKGLMSAKEWYQTQLSQAQETKGKLQQDITLIQRENIASLTLVERLKADNVRSKQALAEQQQKALQEKEQLARHLEKIEADMMEREAAYLQIQQERVAMEEAMHVEEERLRQSEVDSANSEDLKKLQNELRRKQAQVNVLEHEQSQLVKRLTLAQESLLERDRTIDNLDKKYVDVEVCYKQIQKELEMRDEEVLKMKNEKNALDVELSSLKEEKKSFDVSLHAIKDDIGKVEHSFKQMKTELAGRTDELKEAQQNNENLNHQLSAARARLRVLTQRASPQHQPTEVVELVQKETAEKQQSFLPYDIAPVHKEAKDTEGLVVKIVEKQGSSSDGKPEVVIMTEPPSTTSSSSDKGDQEPIADIDNAVIAQLQSQRDSLELQIQELKSINQEINLQLRTQRTDFEADIAKMKEKLAEALDHHQKLKADKNEAEKEVVGTKERLVEMEVTLRSISEERDSLETKLEGNSLISFYILKF